MTSTSTHGFPVAMVGGVPFAAVGLDAAARWVHAAAKTRTGVSIRLANAYSVALAHRNPDYAETLNGEGVNFADGTPVATVVAVRNRRGRLNAHLVRGPSLFARIVDSGELKGYFLGSTEATLAGIVSRLANRGLESSIAGYHAPPFAPLSEAAVDDIVAKIEQSDAEIVWVGMGTPKQDFLTAQIAARVGRPCIGVGAAFDFYAGTQAEAPRWLQGSGLEWVHRFLREPRRLGHRYTIGNFHFLRALVKNSR